MNLTSKRPIRYLITTGEATPENFKSQSVLILETVRKAVEHGIELIQIREKNLTPKLLFDLAQKAVSITSGTSTRSLINDRFDIALAIGADGVHLTSASIPTLKVRRRVPNDFLIAVSTHTHEEVTQAKNAAADLAVYGPVFATPDKGEPKGLEDLRNICAAVTDFPVLALGGINSDNATEVIESGAAGFAAIRYLNNLVNVRL